MDMLDDDSMAPAPFGETGPELLSYDDTIPYEAQVQPESSLASRIGHGKIYLLSETAPGSVKRSNLDEDEAMVDGDSDAGSEDPELRSNALFFTGPPIAHLPTTRIFAYATHFDAHPLGLEWVSDTTCILVFSSTSNAKAAFTCLQKYPDEFPSMDDGTVSAKPIPLPLWPADERISRTLGLDDQATAAEKQKRKDAGLAAPLRMRWARKDDIKKKGARKESEFYRKHGRQAGKATVNGRDIPLTLHDRPESGRKRRREAGEDDEATRARLDEELDAFLAQESGDEQMERPLSERDTLELDALPSPPASPPSRMRSDYIADDGRTVINVRRGSSSSNTGRRDRRGGRSSRRRDETSGGPSLSERIQPSDSGRWERSSDLECGRPERKRRRGDGERNRRRSASPRAARGNEGTGHRRGGGRTEPRPKKTQQELDDELDAFLNQGAP